MAYITHIGTATPEFEIPQDQAAQFMVNALQLDYPESRRLKALYKATRIQKRYSVLADYQKYPNTHFYPQTKNLEPFPSTQARMQLYEQHAQQLAQTAVMDALPQNFDWQSITHLITVSCTGMYAPGLDIDLIQHLNLNKTIHRTAINFMGCYASFNALKSAQAICLAFPQAKVLIAGVELCSLHFQKQLNDDQLLANAIFADGAAAVLVQNHPLTDQLNLQLDQFYCDLIAEGEQDMAWRIGDFGFEMRLSSYIPKLLSSNLKQIIEQACAYFQLSFSEITQFAIHPGGRAILDGISKTLNIPPDTLKHSYDTLANYGNMSSVTILFVLKQLLLERPKMQQGQKILSMAFGPGLTLEAGMMHVV
ncbi:MAG: type III polyketide synthase [Flammeovirgaceae bacterium]